ncbi:helix-hairpin-helix domain-containing protein [Halorubellus sp. JP-L1]|uniref:helix-hairpin-helix domain-containing protein n=1 Tax=Halorubellus sp. JP-L1 TaxID=2715753 RepID=UPI0014094ECF|nr:helix-hairpin-helix domain-containing protein [Halorubellus sp. JP-L1]
MASEETECKGGDAAADRTALPGVDEDGADALADADIAAVDVRERAVSYRDLLAAGIGRETATALRREFSLPYSTTFGEGIEDRSDEVTGLQDGERDWVAASASDWEEMGVPEYDPVEREPEDIWADHDRPTPVTAVSGVGPADAQRLADVGVTSVRQLSFADAGLVADLLDLNVMAVRTWRFQARDRAD